MASVTASALMPSPEADIERMAGDDATPEPPQDDLAHARVVRPYQTNSA